MGNGISLWLVLLRCILTVRTDPPKEDVVAREFKSVSVPDPLFQAGDEIHIHIEDTAAFLTSYMTVIVATVIKAIRPSRSLHPADLSHLRQNVQISIDRSPADVGMILFDLFVNFIRSGMALQSVDSF